MAPDDNGSPAVAEVVVIGSGIGWCRRRPPARRCGRERRPARGRRPGCQSRDPRAGAALRAVGQRAGLGLSHRAAVRLRGPRAALAARQGAGRVECAQRDDLRARSSQRLRHLGVSRQRRLELRGRAAAVQALGGLRPGGVGVPRRRAGRCACCRATSRTRSTPPPSPPPRRRASLSTTTPTASVLDGVAFCQLTIKDGVRQTSATAFLAPVAGTAGLYRAHGRPCPSPALRRRTLRRRRNRAGGCGRADPRRARGRGLRAARSSRRSSCCSPASAPADELGRLGIDVVADLPGVGRNLHDHVLSPVIYGASRRGACGAPWPPAAPQPSLLAQPVRPARALTCSRSSSTCRCTSRAWRARPTATRSWPGSSGRRAAARCDSPPPIRTRRRSSTLRT